MYVNNFVIQRQTKDSTIYIQNKNNKHFDKRPPFFIFMFGMVLLFAYLAYNLPKERELKQVKEVEGIEEKTYKPPKDDCDSCCMQYALVATRSGLYPCYSVECKNGLIWLNATEVWKYGKTCLEDKERYGIKYLREANLRFFVQFKGSEKACLIKEKEKIYNYPKLPECLKRNFILLRPPGNKIDR